MKKLSQLPFLFKLLTETAKKEKEQKRKLIQEFHNVNSQLSSHLSAAVNGIKGVHVKMGNGFAGMIIKNSDASKVIDYLKSRKYYVFYKYPPKEMVEMYVFPGNPDAVKRVLRQYGNILSGFTKA